MMSKTRDNYFDPIEMTAVEIHQARRNGVVTFEEVVQAYLDRIETYNDELNAVITTSTDALDRAAELDAVWDEDGPISAVHGIPTLVKDNTDTHDMPTTAGSVLFENTVPSDDAFIISQLRNAGAVVIAKANLGEFSNGSLSSLGGQTRNPYDLSRDTGGSSSGTGAGIAANLAVLGIGTDTGGSVRLPSGFCSLVGLRPTTGMLSRDGIIPLSDTQDTAGPMTKTVADAAKMMDVMVGYDSADPWTAQIRSNKPESYTDYLDEDGLEGKRLGVVRQFFGPKTDEGDEPGREAQTVTDVIERSFDDMSEAGAEIVDPVEIPEIESILEESGVMEFEFNREMNAYLDELGDNAPVDSPREILESGTVEGYIDLKEYVETGTIPPEDDEAYLKALSVRWDLKKLILTALEDNDLDALLYPTASRITSKIDEDRLYRSSSNTRTAPWANLPAMTVPAGFDPIWETPVGVEFIAGPFEEPELFELGYAYEQASSRRIPPEDFDTV
jgi:Asp-tRNA(Asn)/Glu-tRNA(Gln) amidotransferase A subunit family amidase